jgi:hypothetical protein
MGLMRKTMSMSTMGLVNFRNDSERSAAAERSKKTAYKERTQMEREMRAAELALREKELELLEREQQLRRSN